MFVARMSSNKWMRPRDLIFVAFDIDIIHSEKDFFFIFIYLSISPILISLIDLNQIQSAALIRI